MDVFYFQEPERRPGSGHTASLPGGAQDFKDRRPKSQGLMLRESSRPGREEIITARPWDDRTIDIYDSSSDDGRSIGLTERELPSISEEPDESLQRQGHDSTLASAVTGDNDRRAHSSRRSVSLLTFLSKIGKRKVQKP